MDQNAPKLARQLRSLHPEVRRVILAKACAYAAARLGEVDTAVSELLLAIQTHGKLTPEQAAKAASFAEEADRRSFELEEECAPRTEWLKPFSEARLAMAIMMEFGPDAEGDSSAFYELLKTLDHGAGLEMFIENEISASS